MHKNIPSMWQWFSWGLHDIVSEAIYVTLCPWPFNFTLTFHPVCPCWGHRPQMTWLLSEGHHRHQSQFTWLETDGHRQLNLDMCDLAQWSYYNILNFFHNTHNRHFMVRYALSFVSSKYALCSAFPITTLYAILCSRWPLTLPLTILQQEPHTTRSGTVWSHLTQFDTSRFGENGRCFACNISKSIFLNENCGEVIRISLKIVVKGLISKKPQHWQCSISMG